MNDQLTEQQDPPNPLAVRYSAKRQEWFVWSSFVEKQISASFATKEAAEAVLESLMAGRRA